MVLTLLAVDASEIRQLHYHVEIDETQNCKNKHQEIREILHPTPQKIELETAQTFEAPEI